MVGRLTLLTLLKAPPTCADLTLAFQTEIPVAPELVDFE
jgi:hypothetical protein